MPFKIPLLQRVVVGHRGELVTQLCGLLGAAQPKDDMLASRHIDAALKPAPRQRWLLPSFSVKPVTPFTALTDAHAVARAAQDSTVRLGSCRDLVDSVSRHLVTERQRIQEKSGFDARPVFLVGEIHDSLVALMADMAVIANAGPGTTVLLERSSQGLSVLLEQVRKWDRRLAQDRQSAQQALNSMIHSKSSRLRERAVQILVALAAVKSGARIGCHDLMRHAATTQNEREAKMCREIRGHAQDHSGPLVVIAGYWHVPELHRDMATRGDVVTLCAVCEDTEHPEYPDLRKRASYLFSTNEIMKLRDGGIAASQPDVLQFAEQFLGIDWSRPIRWPRRAAPRPSRGR
jgi:hypothetical protein